MRYRDILRLWRSGHLREYDARQAIAAEDKAVYGVAKCYGPDGERRPQDDATTLTWPWSRTRG